jgi:aspartate/methionine/tyrosine aminotransferase
MPESVTAASDAPTLAVEPNELATVCPGLNDQRPIPPSRMFEIRKALATFHQRCPNRETHDASQGDGGASLPGVSDEVLDRAWELQKNHGTGYDSPRGTELFRKAVVEAYWQLDAATGWGADNVVACQGGRDALLKAYDAAQHLGTGRRGDLVVTSRVPWLSYTWGPYSIGMNVMLAPGSEAAEWRLTPEGLEACFGAASRLERQVALVVITSPDNPTGRSLTLDEQLSLTRAALAGGAPFVLLDWIYHRITEHTPTDLNAFLNALDPDERERCMVLDGITKSLGASNIRNAHLLATAAVVDFIQGRASHGVIPSFFSQAVAVAAYRMGYKRASAGIVKPTLASKARLSELIDAQGMRAILGDGYYAFLDVGPWLDRAGLHDSAELATYCAEEHGLAIVPGAYFSSAGARWLRFSYALPVDKTERAFRRLMEALKALESTAG